MHGLSRSALASLVSFSVCLAAQQAPAPAKANPAQLRTQALTALHEAAQYVNDPSARGSRAIPSFTVSRQLFRAGDRELSAELLKQGLQSAENDQTSRGAFSTAFSLTGWCESQLKVGDKEGAKVCAARAVQIAAHIPEDTRQVTVVRRAATIEEEAGDLVSASQALASLIPLSGAFSNALPDLAAVHVKQNDLAGARALAKGRPDNESGVVLSAVMQAQIASGDLPGAEETANMIPNQVVRVSALIKLGEARGHAGDMKGAEEEFAKAQAIDKIGGNGTPIGIATARANLGNFSGALEILASVKNDRSTNSVPYTYARIAQQMDKAGPPGAGRDVFALALDVAKQLPSQWNPDSVQEHIGLAQAEAGEFAEAKALANIMQEPARSSVLVKIAMEQANHGAVADAEATLAESTERRPVLEIAMAKARKGDFAGASLAASNVINYHTEVLREQARQGDLTGAIAESQRPRDPIQRAYLLTAIAEGLLDAADAAEKDASRTAK